MSSGVFDTFVAALRSVGTAATMALGGFYLHRRNFILPHGKKTLARISQQLTIPAFLFTKIVYCKQDYSNEPCPSITDNLKDGVWVLILWPIYVVGMGLVVGHVAATLSSTPSFQYRSVLAACAFANSTGMPITLLSVVHANFPQTSTLGRVDPTLFLSVYLLLYPVLQWGIGGWLLAPDDSMDQPLEQEEHGHSSGCVRHVLNIESSDTESPSSLIVKKQSSVQDEEEIHYNPQHKQESQSLTGSLTGHAVHNKDDSDSDQLCIQTIASKVLKRALQPPVIGALLGLFVSSIMPLRKLLVDMRDRDNDAIFEWFFDGLYSIGQAAVPLNMFILGINLSSTAQAKTSSKSLCSPQTIVSIVVGKMMVMPLIGVASTWLLRHYVFDIPSNIEASFYIVLMIVCITPTANNVMVMVELSGNGSKEGMAQVLGWQYAMAPILLSLSVMLVVHVANQTG